MNTKYTVAVPAADITLDIVVRSDGSVTSRGRWPEPRGEYLGPWDTKTSRKDAAKLIARARTQGWALTREVV